MSAAGQVIATADTSRFTPSPESREISSTLVALARRFEAIRQAELTRLEPRFASLSLEARIHLDEITRRIVAKLLLTPLERLESVSDATIRVRYVHALNRLFRLTDNEDVAHVAARGR